MSDLRSSLPPYRERITGLTQRTPELLAREIARCRDMTDKPFGVNLTFLPSFSAPPYPEYTAAIREGGVKILESAGRSPEHYMPALKSAGIRVIHKCTSVRHSLKAQQIGCDAVSVDADSLGRVGGHVGCAQPDLVTCDGRVGDEHGHALHRDQGSAGP